LVRLCWETLVSVLVSVAMWYMATNLAAWNRIYLQSHDSVDLNSGLIQLSCVLQSTDSLGENPLPRCSSLTEFTVLWFTMFPGWHSARDGCFFWQVVLSMFKLSRSVHQICLVLQISSPSTTHQRKVLFLRASVINPCPHD
jgi:hypothetical protein